MSETNQLIAQGYLTPRVMSGPDPSRKSFLISKASSPCLVHVQPEPSIDSLFGLLNRENRPLILSSSSLLVNGLGSLKAAKHTKPANSREDIEKKTESSVNIGNLWTIACDNKMCYFRQEKYNSYFTWYCQVWSLAHKILNSPGVIGKSRLEGPWETS